MSENKRLYVDCRLGDNVEILRCIVEGYPHYTLVLIVDLQECEWYQSDEVSVFASENAAKVKIKKTQFV